MHPLVGHPFATTVINFFYQCWVYILYGVLVWQAFALSDRRLRMLVGERVARFGSDCRGGL